MQHSANFTNKKEEKQTCMFILIKFLYQARFKSQQRLVGKKTLDGWSYETAFI